MAGKTRFAEEMDALAKAHPSRLDEPCDLGCGQDNRAHYFAIPEEGEGLRGWQCPAYDTWKEREFRRGWYERGMGRRDPAPTLEYQSGWRLRDSCPLPGGYGLRQAVRWFKAGMKKAA